MKRVREKKTYWISGTVVALAGVASVRLIAPELAGLMQKTILIAGYLFSLSGIFIIAYGANTK
jgi:hypothetical protein